MGFRVEHFFTYEIPLRPTPKNNSRPIFRNKATGKTFLGKNKKLLQYEKEAGMLLRACKNLNRYPTLSGRIHLKVFFEYMGKCPSDGDNLLKAVQDLLQEAGIVENDKMIKRVEMEIIEGALADRTLIQVGVAEQIVQSIGQDGPVPFSEALARLKKV